MFQFKIQDTAFDVPHPQEGGTLTVQSFPRPYDIEFSQSLSPAELVLQASKKAAHALVAIDSKVRDIYFANDSLMQKNALVLNASEEIKTLESVQEIIALMERGKVTKNSTLLVIGGGIAQDIGGFAATIYKRGIPWIYVPTTLLAQTDSCMGGKTALNHHGTKNLLGLFAAPARVLIHSDFLETLPSHDVLSGLGETFRLCLTGGEACFALFENLLPAAIAGDKQALRKMIALSLSIKRAVVEVDEYEFDLRRSMNLGHSVGHAFEALSHYRIPHGIGVSIGIVIESLISMKRGLLGSDEYQRLLRSARLLVPEDMRVILDSIPLDQVVDLLQRDKKTLGSKLKLVVLARIGHIKFIDFPLDETALPFLKECLAQAVKDLRI